jgi:hypothetical protein
LWRKGGALPVEVGRRKGEALAFNRSAVRREWRSPTLHLLCGGRAELFLSNSCGRREKEGRSPSLETSRLCEGNGLSPSTRSEPLSIRANKDFQTGSTEMVGRRERYTAEVVLTRPV